MKKVLLLLTAVFSLSVLYAQCDYQASVTADFIERDQFPEFIRPSFNDTWGPRPRLYPPPAVPPGCDSVRWRQERIVAVAKKYIGLPYQHHHIPSYNPPDEGPGLDCSNFSAWVVNYALGIQISSNVEEQAATAGRLLKQGEPYEPGDLLFIKPWDSDRISHVAIFIDEGNLIDCHNEHSEPPSLGVRIRPFKGWYKIRLDHVRRVVPGG